MSNKRWSITLPLKGILALVLLGIHGGFPWWLYPLVFWVSLIVTRS